MKQVLYLNVNQDGLSVPFVDAFMCLICVILLRSVQMHQMR